MVTDYINNKCKYTFSKLKKVVYLVSEEHLKDVIIDNGEAYISGLTELPLRLNGFDIQFNEEDSLDERYLFTKSVTLSMHGYVNSGVFEGKYYIILEDMDGTYWMVNVDFPSRVTYTFNLSKYNYQTDFTLSSYSNFPTLKLNADFVAVEPPCLGFSVFGVDKLRLIDFGDAQINTTTRTLSVYADKSFKDIDYLGNSCSFTSQFDGFNVTDTIEFQIPFDAYKSSWHYNLLEFVKNKYSAIVTPKSFNNEFYVGFNFGMQPSYRVETGNREDSDIITITLTETSAYGLVPAVDWSEEQRTETKWVWAKDVNGIQCWECVAKGKARYLMKKEVYDNGQGTGNYMAMDGYEQYFIDAGINVTDTFTGDTYFSNSTCGGQYCEITTTMPTVISFSSVTCQAFALEAECEWHIENIDSNWLTVSPMSGDGVQDTVSVCNSKTVTEFERGSFDIVAGDNVQHITVELNNSTYFISPPTAYIDCLSQDVYFTYNPLCPITVWSSDTRTTWHRTDGNLIVRVPRNYELSSVTYQYTIKDCEARTQIISIVQDKTYENWIPTTGYICESGNSYTREVRYTGTTSGNCNVITGEYRKGTLIQSGDARCAETVYTRWVVSSEYICIDGNKWSQEEEEISTDGTNWTKTGSVRPLAMVESGSTYCQQTITYSWVLTQQWQCEENPAPVPPEPTDYSTQYLTFESEGDNTSLYLVINPSYYSYRKTISASTDNGATWTAFTATREWTQIATLDTGEKVLVKGENGSYRYNTFGSDDGTQRFKVYGNIMSLISGDSFTSATTFSEGYTFSQLFETFAGLTDASNLVLPATTLSDHCYHHMFYNCTNLTLAPALPATTLVGDCYQYMFYGCSRLAYAPALPATTLKYGCYGYMFYGCTSLTTAPALPATTLESMCYYEMFHDCTSLTTAPELPATSLAISCYGYMFQGCTNLNYIKCLATDLSGSQCTKNWVYGVSQTGTFVKDSSMTGWTTGQSGIPSGWSVQDAT